MRYLADTHLLLWWLAGKPVPKPVKKVLSNPDHEVFVSAVSGWEISIKRAMGKLKAPENLFPLLAEEGFEHLPVTFAHGELACSLPPVHRDPFDRMLVAQATLEKLVILTGDENIPKYGVRTLWH